MTTTESQEIVLYDLPATYKGNDSYACFSSSAWKARMALNYKGVPYKTEWTEYPDLEPKLKAYGVPPNDPATSWASYTSPTIRLPDGTFVVDSVNIAQTLERLYPTPSLHLSAAETGNLPEQLSNLMTQVTISIGAGGMLRFLAIVPPRSAAYVREAREKAFGMTMEEFVATRGGEEEWKKAEAEGGLLDQLRKTMFENEWRKGTGPFVLGEKPSFADFVVIGLFQGFEIVYPEAYQRIVKFDARFAALHEACRPWVQRDY